MNNIFNRSIETMTDAIEEEKAEFERIRNLPDLKGVIVSKSQIENPLTGNSAGIYLMMLGYSQKIEKNSSIGGRFRSSSSGPDFITKHTYEYLLESPDSTFIKIADKLYPLDFDLIRLSKVGEFDSHKSGVIAETIRAINTDYGYPIIESMETIEKKQAKRVEMKSKIKNFQGRHMLVDKFLNEEGDVYSLDILILTEVLFQNGDTMMFKGEIKGDSLIALF